MSYRIDKITVTIEWTADFEGHRSTTFAVDLPDPTDDFTRAVLDKNSRLITAAIQRGPNEIDLG